MFEGIRNVWRRFQYSLTDQEVGIEDPEEIRREILDLVEGSDFKKRVWFVASSGFFADAYSLFATNVITPALAYIYWPCETRNVYGISINEVTLAGSLIGMLLFGHLADRVGRTSLYGTELVIAIIATIGVTQAGAGYDQQSMHIIGWIVFWRFLLGIGIGAEYPLSALIASEWTSTQSRGRMLAAVFLVQPLGQLSAYATGYFALLGIANSHGLSHDETNHDIAAPILDIVWRIVIGVGALTSLFAIVLRITIPETPRWLLTTKPKTALQSAWRVFTDVNSSRSRRIGHRETGNPGTELTNMGNRGADAGTSLLASQDTSDQESGDDAELEQNGTSTQNSDLDAEHRRFRRRESPEIQVLSLPKPALDEVRTTVTEENVPEDQGSNASEYHPEPEQNKSKWWREWKTFMKNGYNTRILIGLSLCWCLLDVAFYGIGLDNPRTMAKIWASPSGQTTAAVVTGSVQCNSSTRPGTIYDWQSDFESYDSGIVKTLLWDSKRALLATSIASTVGSLVFLLIVDYVPRVGTLIATFIVLAILFLVAGTSLIAVYEDEYHSVAIAFYALALLVFNLGPNTITFMLPAELFSTKYRGTCYGIAAASGKLGAIIIQIIGRVVGVSNPSRGKWPLIAMLLAFCLVMLLGAFSAWTCVPEVQHSPGTRLDGRGNPREGPDTVSLFAAKRRMPPRSLENIQKTPVPDDQKLGIRINVELLWKTIRDPLKKKESV